MKPDSAVTWLSASVEDCSLIVSAYKFIQFNTHFFFLAKFIGGHSPISSLINTIIKRQSKRKQTLVKFSYPTILTQEIKLKLYSMRNPSSKVKTNKSILYLRDHFFFLEIMVDIERVMMFFPCIFDGL